MGNGKYSIYLGLVIELSEDKKKYDLEIFARGYAQAWCSQRPNFVSSFFC